MPEVDRLMGLVGNVAFKAPCRVATTTSLGANMAGLPIIDGVQLASGDRVLRKNEATPALNGVWNADTGPWIRAPDMDGTYDVIQGTMVYIAQGTQGNQVYCLTTADPITIGTTGMTWTVGLFSGLGNTPFLQAGAGAVPITVQDDLRVATITPEQFGAIGDNATDDKAALALCITAAAGRSIKFTKVYKVSTNGLSFPANVGLIFEKGAQLAPAGAIVITIDGPIQSHSGAAIFSGAGTITATFLASGINGLSNYFAGAYAGTLNVPGAADVGCGNTAVGAQALRANVTGYGHTAIGSNSMQNALSVRYCVAVGRNTLTNAVNGGEQCVAVGFNALYNWVGTGVGGNVAVGTNALLGLTTGTGNTAIGHNALDAGTTHTGCTAVGINAGNSNTAVGLTAVGESAMAVNTGTLNTAVGQFAADGNTSGIKNTIVGSISFRSNTTGSNNTVVGAQAAAASTGNGNTAVGEESMAVANTTNVTAIGYLSLSTLETGANNFGVGYNSQPSAVGVSNEGTLGSTALATLRCQVALTVLSDERDKVEVGALPGLAFVRKMKTLWHRWQKRDGSENPEGTFAGLSAQNLRALQDEFKADLGLVHSINPDRLEATYERVIPVLVKAIQELAAEFDAYKSAHP